MPMWSALYLLWGYHSPKNHITRREKPPYRDPINLRKLLGWNNVLFGEGNIEPVEDLPLWVLVWLLLVSCQTTVEPPFSWSGDVSENQTRPRKPLREVVEHIPSSHSDIMNRIYIYIYIDVRKNSHKKMNTFLQLAEHLRFPPALAITCWAQLPHPSIRPSALKRSTKAVKEITKRSCEAAKKPREEGYDMDEKRGSNGI